jgi:hypothetical protein
MKKLSLLTAMMISVSACAHADTLTYLVNFGPTGGPSFSGDPAIFEDASGNALPSSTTIVNPGATSETYSLGSATLTLSGLTYSFGASGTDQTAVTHSFADPQGGTSDTFTLTGLPAGDTINFQFLGSSQPFLADAAVAAGSTAPTSASTLIGAAPDPVTVGGIITVANIPQFTNVATLTGSTQYTGLFAQSGPGEGDIGAAYITITTPSLSAAPEPSTYLMFGMGFSVLLFALRRKAKTTRV